MVGSCLYKFAAFGLFLLLFATSCNGQKKSMPATNARNLKPTDTGQPKIIVSSQTAQQGMFRCSMIDRAGNLWLGTTLLGALYRYDGKTFVGFTDKDGLACKSVYSVVEDAKGTIWVGTDSGLFRSDGDRFAHVDIPGAGEGASIPMGSIARPVSGQTAMPKRAPLRESSWDARNGRCNRSRVCAGSPGVRLRHPRTHPRASPR